MAGLDSLFAQLRMVCYHKETANRKDRNMPNPPTMPEHLKRVRRDNKLGVRGIYYDDFKRRFCVQKAINGRRKHLSYTSTLEEAQHLYERS
jgi:hypothetical protein